jgi:GAF domain-containing protein
VPGLFQDEQVELVKTFADQAAVAIANARLLDAVRRQRTELARFVSPQVAELISSSEGEQLLAGHRAYRLRARGGELLGEVEDYEDIYRLCYVRGPEGIIVELPERIGWGSGRRRSPSSAPWALIVADEAIRRREHRIHVRHPELAA